MERRRLHVSDSVVLHRFQQARKTRDFLECADSHVTGTEELAKSPRMIAGQISVVAIAGDAACMSEKMRAAN